MSEVRVRENESLDSALKRFKRSCAKSGVLAEVRRREHYESPSVKRRKKSEAARKDVYKRQVVTCVFPNADIVSARGELFGAIAYAPMGAGGFGYDPVFFVTHMKKTLAQMTMKERQSCSHRAAAIRRCV